MEQEEVFSGGVHITLNCACDEAWATFGDFGGLRKWNPSVKMCKLVAGKNNEPGCVRFVEGALAGSGVYETLLVHDKEKCVQKYNIEGNRFPYFHGDVHGYVAQIQCHDMGNGKTLINWTYTVEPMAPETYKQFTTFVTRFYMYQLRILQSVVDAPTSSLSSIPQKDTQHGKTDSEDAPIPSTHSRL